MNQMQDSLRAINELNLRAVAIANAIANEMQSLDDNPRIHRLNDRSFVIKSSDLGDNWTPGYHDFLLQYRKIVEYIMKDGPACISDRLGRCLAEKSVPGEGIRLHPDVICKIHELIGGM